MLFNTIEFAVFFSLVFILYRFVFRKSLKCQNFFLLLSSYFFYACWDWRFLFLLSASTVVGFVSGLQIAGARTMQKKRNWLILSVCLNLGFLGFFKYYNFFIESFADLLLIGGFTPHLITLNIILPVGISFYTFHGLSYIFDIYNNKIRPTSDLVNYSLFVSFFPLLVAGPIERAAHLLPQIEKERRFSYFESVDGLRRILWGLFKKVVIADNCAVYVNQIFNNYDDFSGSTLFLGAVLFSFQIYGDFSGYSDIALGTARLLGFDLLRNFNYPYFSRNIAEFWRRWHISLTTWFRDYLYIPLGGSRKALHVTVRNIFVIFLLSGFWHGANWTFVIWGGINAVYFIPSLILGKNRKYLNTVAEGKTLPSFKEIAQMAITFLLVSVAWIFFRSENIGMAFDILGKIFSSSLFSIPEISVKALMCLLVIFVFIEWIGRETNFGIANISRNIKYVGVRWLFYLILVFAILANATKGSEFIYFRF